MKPYPIHVLHGLAKSMEKLELINGMLYVWELQR